MKFNVMYTLRTPENRTVEMASPTNPVEYVNLASLLSFLANNVPQSAVSETVGIRVDRVEEPTTGAKQ